jgi:hypothetical protein
MARVKSAMAGKGSLVEEEVASTPSAAADSPRKTLSVSDMDDERNLSARGGQQLARMHLFRGGFMFG